MKDVINVDSAIERMVDNIGESKNERRDDTSQIFEELKQDVYSLLISKLPEKREHGDNNGKTAMPSEVIGFNKAVDDIHRVIDELFEVGDE